MAELLLRLRDREVSRTPIRNTRLTLGRDVSSDLVIDNAAVSRTHAILIYVDEKFRIRDGSQNGLLINGKLVKDAVLSYGDVIGIGKFEVVLQETAEELPLQAGSQAKPSAVKNVIGTLALEDAGASRPRAEPAAAAKPAGKPISTTARLDAALPTDPAPAMPSATAEAAAVVESGTHPATRPTQPEAAAVPAPRRKSTDVDIQAVLKLAGIVLVVVLMAMGGALWWLARNDPYRDMQIEPVAGR